MQHGVEETLSGLRGIGSVAEIRAQAENGLAPKQRPKVNSHIHLPPNFSAFVSVKQAVELAAQQHMGVVGVTNYYDYDVYHDFASLARQHGIFPLFGLEIIALIDDLVHAGIKINDPGNPGRIYICGKGITRFAPMSPMAEGMVNVIRRSDCERMRTMVQKLEAIFAERGVPTGLTEGAVIDRVVTRYNCPRNRVYLQERHICQAFQERFFELTAPAARQAQLEKLLGAPSKADGNPVRTQNEMRAHLVRAGKPAFVEERFLSFEQAYQLILEMGGIPCYPTLADGTKPVCPYEEPVEKLIETLKANRIYMAEFIPIRNTPQVLWHYVKAMRAAGLAVVAGTEHNTLDLLPIEPACLNAQPIPEDVKDIFWEGACVAAAHQFLNLHGQCGFVDAHGRADPSYGSDEQRIKAFAKLGAAVIERYHQGR